MIPFRKKKYDGNTLWLCEPDPCGKYPYTTKELRWINHIRNELIKAGHDPEITCENIKEFIEDGWFYSRNPYYNNIP